MIFDGDKALLGEYIRHLADEVGLRDWYLVLGDTEPDHETAGADCEVVYGQKSATIRFRKEWATWDAEQVRRIAVHELIHCHTWSMDQRICDLSGVVGSVVYDVVQRSFREDLERAVDGMAREWAKTLPLPVVAKKKHKEAK